MLRAEGEKLISGNKSNWGVEGLWLITVGVETATYNYHTVFTRF
jgi:hypothetical protein